MEGGYAIKEGNGATVILLTTSDKQILICHSVELISLKLLERQGSY